MTQSDFLTPSGGAAELGPRRTPDPVEAWGLVQVDGAVILTGAGATAEAAMAAARTVFAGRALAIPEAAEVRAGGVMDQVVNRPSPEEALGVHTDGFGYGDFYPDYFILLCARDSAVGGESFLVDGYQLLDRLGSTGRPGLGEQLETVPFDQTEEGMHRSVSPLVGRTAGGRRMVRRFPFQRPRSESADPDADTALLGEWDRMCREAGASALRFRLQAGEAAIIDNYRMLHGREPYKDVERLMWRVWVWTDAAKGVPAGSLASDTRYARVPSEIAGDDWPMITADSGSCLPEEAPGWERAGELVRRDGAALITGIDTLDDAVVAARAMLGDRAVQVKPQFEATTAGYLANQVKVAGSGPDRRGRVRRFTPPGEIMIPHNDGYGFGDLAPDYLFLWCEKPDPSGGASWVVDGVRLLEALTEETSSAPLATFCWSEPIDHSEPGFIVNQPAPVARLLPGGRRQVRHNPYLTPVASDHEAADAPMVAAWCEVVTTARDRAHRFALQAGQLLCIDNYRMMHGRDPYTDDDRRVVSIWGWSTDAVDVPDRELHLV